MNDPIPLFVHWTKFLKWLLPKTGGFPRSIRFTFTQRIDNLALDVLEDIIAAQYDPHRRAQLRRISLNIDKLRILLRICHDLAYLDHRGYEVASRELAEAGRMTGGWLKHEGRGA